MIALVEWTEVLRLVLAVTLGVAAAAKLADRAGAVQAVRSFGVPGRAAGAVAVLLPIVEATVAVALLPVSAARPAAMVAAVLFAAFAVVVATARLRGRTPDCHCFGRLHSAPAGWSVVARNVLLFGLAAAVASRSASPIGMAELTGFVVVAVIVGQAGAGYTLLRRYGRALSRIEELEAGDGRPVGLEVGAEAPWFNLRSVEGGQVTLDGLLAVGRPLVLVFSDPGCGPCKALMPKLSVWQRSLAERLTIAVVSGGSREDNLALATEHALVNVLEQDDRDVVALFGAWATPSAVLVGANGRIERTVIAGAEAIEGLVESLADDRRPASGQLVTGQSRYAAAAVGGGLAITAAAARGASMSEVEELADPELAAFEKAFQEAAPELSRAAARSSKATPDASILRGGAQARRKRLAAAQALEAERSAVLRLRTRLERLAATSAQAQNVKASALSGLQLLAQSLRARSKAVVAAPKARPGLVDEGERLLLRSIQALVAAAEVMAQ